MVIQFPRSPADLPEYVRQLNESLSREPQKVVSLDERRTELKRAFLAYIRGDKPTPPSAA